MCQASTHLSSSNYRDALPKLYPEQESVDASHREEVETYEQQEQLSMAWEETV